MKIITSVMGVVGASLVLASAASAGGPVVVNAPDSARISYSDLNMASAAGLDALKGRVKNAAQQLCQYTISEPQILIGPRRACFTTAMDDGFSKADQLHRLSQSGIVTVGAGSITISGK